MTKNKRRSRAVRERAANNGESYTAAMFAATQQHTASAESAAPVPHQLPADVHGFIGREDELERLGTALAGVILVAGTAGAGKTALAVRFAHRASARFPDGHLFVNLRGYDSGPPLDALSALERVLRALGTAPQAIPLDLEERAQLYRSLLAGKRVMVLLDNAATIGQVRPLLPGEPGCLVLVTSRNRLPGLTARHGAYRLDLGLLSEAQAVALVSAATAKYRDGDDPGQVAELARLCAGLPLALRIAAERAAGRPSMALRGLIAELRGESALWDALSAEDGEQEAVRAVFAWSYRALPAAAARALRRLGLHPGPHFGLGAAAAVIGESAERARDLLDMLVGAHLLEQTAGRYQFHDLLRAYAVGRAHTEEDEQQRRAALERVAAWYLHSADAASRAAQSYFAPVMGEVPQSAVEPAAFEDYGSALHWHRAEQANLLALVRAAPGAGLDQIAWQLPATLYGLHIAHSPFEDWLEMGAIALDAARRLGDPRAEALAHESLGTANKAAGRLDEAAEHHLAALELRTGLGERAAAAHSAHSLGLVHLQQRELRQARDRFEQSLAFARKNHDGAQAASALCCLAYTAAELGEAELAARLAEQSLTLHGQSGVDPYLQVDPLLLLARLHREARNFDTADDFLGQVDAAVARLDHRALQNAALLEHADLARAKGDDEQALDLYWQYTNLQRSSGDRARQALAFDGIGCTLRALGRLAEAIEFHQAAAALSRRPHHPWQLALSLCHLAEALAHAGQDELAETARTEAHELLAGFTDPQANALRERLRTRPQPAES